MLENENGEYKERTPNVRNQEVRRSSRVPNLEKGQNWKRDWQGAEKVLRSQSRRNKKKKVRKEK